MFPKVVINFASSTAYIFTPDGDDEIKLDSSGSTIEKKNIPCYKTSLRDHGNKGLHLYYVQTTAHT
jgi:hypothetical protein